MSDNPDTNCLDDRLPMLSLGWPSKKKLLNVHISSAKSVDGSTALDKLKGSLVYLTKPFYSYMIF